MKQKVCYVIVDPDGRELWYTLAYEETDCIGNACEHEGETWKSWESAGYQVKTLYLSDKEDSSNYYSVFREGDGK